MSNSFDPTVRRFLRAAEQRFTEAETLLQAQFFLGSMYLAGYVPECAIKALILARTPASQRASTLTDAFRGRRGHDYEELKVALRKTGCVIPLDVARHFRHISSWSTDLRYTVTRQKKTSAQRYLESAKGIMDWVQRSI